MAILDRQGRLFGKVSILDLGAILAIVIALFGLFFVPGKSGDTIAQIGTAPIKPVEVEIMVRGLTVRYPDQLVQVGEKTQIIIRNNPRGEVEITAAEALIPKVPVPMLDGTVKALEDPRLSEIYVRDFAITLAGDAQVTNDGVIFGGEKVKIGTQVEIESPKYVMRGSVMDIRYEA
jgi:hypothetical protein